MTVVVLGEPPTEVTDWLERRRALGQDGYDEVWEGVYHVAPMAHPWHGDLQFQLARRLGPPADAAALILTGPFNLGTGKADFRVPDAGVHRGHPTRLYVPTAAMVVEVLSPYDETWAKLGFYAGCGVEEILIVDPPARRATLLGLVDGEYVERPASALLDLDAAALTAGLTWPTTS